MGLFLFWGQFLLKHVSTNEVLLFHKIEKIKKIRTGTKISKYLSELQNLEIINI